MAELRPHKRVNDILLGPWERPLLRWLAAHMPGWMTPDILTGIGVLGAAVTFVSYALSNASGWFLWLASLGLVINWFGDSLDGTLARFRHIERPRYGFFVDHTVDAFNECLVVLGLGLTPYVRFDVACLALIGYLLMSVLVYVRTYVDGVFKISYGRFGPTEVRLIVIILNAIMFFVAPPTFTLSFGVFTLFDALVGALAVILGAIYVTSVIQHAQELAH
jgi:archaetidylinositol phosphate synthase